jgi:NADH-quinone oxidoreductase subunit N
MLAFSGISHAGFMLMVILNIATAASTLLYYTAAYALAGIASFAVIIYVTKNKDNEDITNFNGLGKTNPLLAAVLTASLFSMAGIPIFAGFFAKFMLFSQTIKAGFLVVVIAGVINSIISIGYYFKLILAMYTKEATEEKHSVPFVYYVVAVLAILLNILLGIYPSFLNNLLN